MSESDSSDSELLLQAFPVPPSDTTDPPSIEKALTSPEEYIKFVRYEASSYPKVLHSGFVPSEPAEEAGQENNNFCSSSFEALPQSNEYLLSNFDSTVEEFRAVKILLSRMELDETQKIKTVISDDLFENPPSLLWIAQRSRSELGELAELVSSHCTKKRWKPDLTTAYPHDANGLVERFHRQLKTAITASSPDARWFERLLAILLGIRNTANEIRYCPDELIFGTTLRLPRVVT